MGCTAFNPSSEPRAPKDSDKSHLRAPGRCRQHVAPMPHCGRIRPPFC